MAIPKTFLIKLNGNPVAVMPFLPGDFKPLTAYKKKDPNKIIESMEKYRKSGMLHMCAILEWVLGAVDSHSNNILMAPDGSIALLDHGSTFSGESFNPAQDINSYIPFYLRYRVEKGFKKLDSQERLHKIITVDYRIDDFLKQWLNRIDINKISGIIKEFGIDPSPMINRFQDLKNHVGSLSDYVNYLWAVGKPIEENVLKHEIQKEIIKQLIVGEL